MPPFKPSYFCSLLLLLGFSACQPAVEPTVESEHGSADSLVYERELIERNFGCNDSNQQGPCLEVYIEKLAMTEGSTAAARQKINQFLSRQISETDNAETAARNPEEVADNLLREYRQITQEMPDYRLPWEYRREWKVFLNHHGLLGVRLTAYSYTGGAHPVTFDYFYTFDIDNGRQLSLSDLLRKGAEINLRRLAENEFISKQELDTSMSYEDAGYWFEDDQFELSENFRYTPKNLSLLYNPYEIAPFSEGPITIKLPYASVADLIKPEYRF